MKRKWTNDIAAWNRCFEEESIAAERACAARIAIVSEEEDVRGWQQAALGAAVPTPEVQPAKAECRQLPQLPLDQQHLHNRLQSQPSPLPQQQPRQSLPDGGNDGHSGPDGNSGPGEHQRRWPTTGARHGGGADTKGTVDIQSRCPPTTAAPQPAESDAARGRTRNDTAHSESQPTPLAKCFKFFFLAKGIPPDRRKQ